jgi:hypothetical protein
LISYNIYIGGYDHKSGGVRALHVLRDELRLRGFEAEMTYEKVLPDSLMIYPEIFSGNPLGWPRYVKWLLNKADFPGETCWSWEPGCGPHQLLTVSIIELDIWKPRRDKHNEVAYWVGKGQVDWTLVPENAKEINRSNFHTRVELAEYVSGLDYLISFDPFTALTMEAAVSGVPVLIHNRYPLWTTEEVAQSDWLKFGIATSLDEMQHARKTVNLARDHYKNLEKIFAQRIDNFVEETQRT